VLPRVGLEGGQMHAQLSVRCGLQQAYQLHELPVLGVHLRIAEQQGVAPWQWG
jgi:hypothetical protein